MIRSVARMASGKTFDLIPFAYRQFDDPQYGGAKITMSKEEFTEKLNKYYDEHSPSLKEGYAPFCKHLFVPNFTEAKISSLKLTDENRVHLVSGYHARTEKELPVLERWFPKESLPEELITKATYLDVILYSKEQVDLENKEMGEEFDLNAPWGIVSIKAQNEDHELPMNPITVMRNGLGKDQGGSGVAIEREKYMESVEYWEN
eukprot:CAMPEP_0201506938 /NCGR_PEP_ID=MMETSP0161_2-20130828/764_1 /ASSEMBLY_ACC=CAM_ASM_000251 /TAXON_ID=180227 /ORGANISM="Neoparamoeba aestuarina, Strain SoJaBio B1-5/56/2" /LENGTH=203 /DNA_ID=CAMNT_0047901183 /DNA_START=1 /DNA_END=609 /DNA_ORIENTATION=+